MTVREKIVCTCDDEFRRGHFGHRAGCQLEAALDDAYVRGWEDAVRQVPLEHRPSEDPRALLRVWASGTL